MAFVRYGQDAFELKLLDVYYKLQEAEKLGIIRDDTTENDAYEFTSKQMVSAIKDKYRRNRNEKDISPVYLYQVVREYNKRIFQAYIFFFKDIANTNPELVRQLAILSRSFDPEENSEQIIKYNEKAGDQFSETGNLQKAIEFYEYLLNEIVPENIETERSRLLDKLFQHYLDMGTETQKMLIKVVERMNLQNVPTSIILKYSLALIRTTEDVESGKNYELINLMLNELKKSDLDNNEEIRRRFYMIHSLILLVKDFSYSDEYFVEWRTGLTRMVEELENDANRNEEMCQLFGEILNTLALSYARTRPPVSHLDFETGKGLLDRRLRLLLKEKNVGTYPNWDVRLKALQYCLGKLRDKDPSLTHHDKVSMKYLYSYYTELFINAGEPTGTCLALSEMAVEVNRNLFDFKGILLSLDPLTDLYSTVGREKETEELLEEGLRIAETFKFPRLERLERKFIIKLARFPVERQIHCLRHFILPESEELLDIAVKLSTTPEDLKNYYNIAGSKFHKSFAKDPLTCFVRLRKELRFSNITQERQQILNTNFRFSKEMYPNGIGFSNVISIEEITEDDKQNMEQKERDGIKVNVLKTNNTVNTWQANLVIERNSIPTVLTLYPGEPAPPLPDQRYLTGDELERSKKFWESHLFLESL